MVEHDAARMQTWAETREKQETERAISQQSASRHLSVMAVQSIACCVAVLLALLLRVAGGDAYHSLRHSFQQALVRNEWVSAMALLWDGNPLEKEVPSDVKELGFAGEESAQLTGSADAVIAVAPLESGTLTSGFGERIHPIDGTTETHTGVDIAAPMGTDLVAVYDGIVTEVGEEARLGKYVRLDHGGGIEILYGHCEEVLAVQGMSVRAGERVALVGSTGVSTGSHVHIRVTVDGAVCDPATLLSLERYA